MVNATATTTQSARLFKYILATWLIAGTLDGLTAVLVSGVGFERVFKYVASGAFGIGAMQGGNEMVIAGVLFHYLIALCWTLLFYYLYPRMKVLTANKFIVGLLYGIFVWCVMNLIVVPLSQIPARPFQLQGAVINAVVLMFMIGLPISLMANKYYGKR
jgi:hypothetical protein